MNETFFSTIDFVNAWSQAFGNSYHTLAIPVNGSGPPRMMYAVQTMPGFQKLRYISLAPHGLYASPGWQGQLEPSTLKGIHDRLTEFWTRSFTWNVRFDQQPLADGLISLGYNFQHTSTHVLYLGKDYEHIFTGYSSTTRNHVRKSHRHGVVVRDALDPADVHAYDQIHTQLADQKGGYAVIYPIKLFSELTKLCGTVRVLVAEWENRIIGGGVFIKDGSSIMYLHGASDREYSWCYPSCAVLDEAIRWGCKSGATFFNFGGSAGLASLEKFKSFWGAQAELNWKFEWTNPFWTRLSHLKAKIIRSSALNS